MGHVGGNMGGSLRNLISNRYLHKLIISLVIIVILFVLGIIILKYHVEGETNMPFYLSKISAISSSEGIDKPTTDTKWAFDVFQNNDIFLYINKNEQYGKVEAIKSVVIDNIRFDGNNKDNIKIYKPDSEEENSIFKFKEENKVERIEYTGNMESNLKYLMISNQGGVIAFRCSYDNLAEYKSNDEEINHQELLKKAGILEEDLKAKITFDLSINLENGKQYKTTISLDIPVENVVEQGIASKEITDLKKFIFKRVNN